MSGAANARARGEGAGGCVKRRWHAISGPAVRYLWIALWKSLMGQRGSHRGYHRASTYRDQSFVANHSCLLRCGRQVPQRRPPARSEKIPACEPLTRHPCALAPRWRFRS